MTPNTEILIVGAGPTGLLLAAELCRRGIDCLAIDAHDAPLHWDRATVVHPRSLEILDSVGLAEELVAAGVKQRIARLHSAGAVLGDIDLALCGSRYPFNIGLSEEVTEAVIAAYLRRQGGDVVRGARLTGLADMPDGLRATIVRDGAAHTVAARFVVGCDGLHSVTRDLMGIALEGHDIAEPWAVFDADLPGWPHPHEANYAYLDATPVILTALPGRRWRVYLRPTAPDSDLVADATATLARYLPAARFAAVENPVRFHCHTRVARRFRAGRVLLAGDAAHVCSPAQGHGMNSGLQDAFNLAWKLALVVRGASASALLDSYEAERRPVAQAVTASGDEAEQAQAVAGAMARTARDAAIRAAFADPASRHHEAVAEAELDIDYAASPIVMGDAHPALAPGQRLPDSLVVGWEDGERALHALAWRAGHTALLIGADVTLREAVRAACRAPVTEALVTVQDVPAETAAALGMRGALLLAMRPDGHVGLRADRGHAAALAAYQARLATGG